jgi:hypothetical protein
VISYDWHIPPIESLQQYQRIATFDTVTCPSSPPLLPIEHYQRHSLLMPTVWQLYAPIEHQYHIID